MINLTIKIGSNLGLKIAFAIFALSLGACSKKQGSGVKLPTQFRQSKKQKLKYNEETKVTMNDGSRQWSVALPRVQGGYEIKVPLGETGSLPSGVHHQLKKEDREAGFDEEPGTDAYKERKRREYLQVRSNIRNLFKEGNFELAQLELEALLKEYPQDSKLLAMNGTLYLKMNEKEKALEFYQQALSIDGNNSTLEKAIEDLQLDSEEEAERRDEEEDQE